MTDSLYKALNARRDFTAVYLDVTKYFDRMWHEGLLFRCEHDYYITDSLHDWLKSYLTNLEDRCHAFEPPDDKRRMPSGLHSRLTFSTPLS